MTRNPKARELHKDKMPTRQLATCSKQQITKLPKEGEKTASLIEYRTKANTKATNATSLWADDILFNERTNTCLGRAVSSKLFFFFFFKSVLNVTQIQELSCKMMSLSPLPLDQQCLLQLSYIIIISCHLHNGQPHQSPTLLFLAILFKSVFVLSNPSLNGIILFKLIYHFCLIFAPFFCTFTFFIIQPFLHIKVGNEKS